MTRRVVVMAASAGGIEALQTVLRDLSPDFGAPVLVVLHMAAGSGSAPRNSRAAPAAADPSVAKVIFSIAVSPPATTPVYPAPRAG